MTDATLLVQFAIFFVLLACSALISGAEVALFSLSSTEINTARDSDSPTQQLIVRLLSRPKKLLATVLIANNLINISIVLVFVDLGEFLFSGFGNYRIFDLVSLRSVMDIGVVTFFILLFGEILPKIYANRNNLAFASRIVYPIYVLDVIFSPLSVPMRNMTVWLHKKLGKKSSNISVGQLSQALELASAEDTTHEEKKILESIVSFGSTEIRQVMVPRVDIFALNDLLLFSEVLERIKSMGYSRMPVYSEHLDNITGVIYIKDLLPHIDRVDFDWLSVKRKAFFVPENKKLDDLLSEFQEKKIHLAIVVDEYGGTCGIITLEDIIEEIVGDISDEFDDEDVIYSKLDENTFIFEGKTVLKDFYRIMDVSDADEDRFEDTKGDAETLAGFLLETAGAFPQKNVPITFENYTFTVEAFDKKRIKQIKTVRHVVS
ncbi:MAG: gliding motility-associated protein GldE [Capnocytophaga sp.]|nr:gliding motility-associated protein GldE [Capnocytophaga sp.]